MKDISLYGHLTIDTILEGSCERKTLGSIANVWKSLIEIDPTINIGLSPIDIGQALIYIDSVSAQRYSKANLNLTKNKVKTFDSKIHHIAYLNEITTVEFISNLNGIVTADVCSGKELNKDLLKYIDYLFISDEDIEENFNDYVDSAKGYVILHSSSGSVVSNGDVKFAYKMPKELILKGVNVLGAGDTFASCFLYKLLKGVGNIQNWIEFAHLKTTEIIRNSI
jgi:sugar/nucleoside kinase (ribokinase family)